MVISIVLSFFNNDDYRNRTATIFRFILIRRIARLSTTFISYQTNPARYKKLEKSTLKIQLSEHIESWVEML